VTQYVDSSALLAALLDEPMTDRVQTLLDADPDWLTGRHTFVEVRRNLARTIAPIDLDSARADFAVYWARTMIVELDAVTCDLAAQVTEATGVRTLDALHLAAARRVGGSEIAVLTLDRRLRDAARTLGMPTPE
jgi:predicted nucleic acid-binding protein